MRGTEEEDAEIRMLRGLVGAAPYFGASERLATALVSATGHTDPVVVDGALRALGVVGGSANASFLANRLRELDPGDVARRAIVLGALAELSGPRGVEVLGELVDRDALRRHELLGVLLDVRARPDGAAIVAKLRDNADPVVAAAAAIELPEPTGGAPRSVRVLLGDRSEFTGRCCGSDRTRCASPASRGSSSRAFRASSARASCSRRTRPRRRRVRCGCSRRAAA